MIFVNVTRIASYVLLGVVSWMGGLPWWVAPALALYDIPWVKGWKLPWVKSPPRGGQDGSDQLTLQQLMQWRAMSERSKETLQ